MRVVVSTQLPLSVVNRVHGFVKAIIEKTNTTCFVMDPAGWEIPLFILPELDERLIYVVRDVIRATCGLQHPLGLSFTGMFFDDKGRIVVPVKGAFLELQECRNAIVRGLQDLMAPEVELTDFAGLVIGEHRGEESRELTFKKPVSWNVKELWVYSEFKSLMKRRMALNIVGGEDAVVHS